MKLFKLLITGLTLLFAGCASVNSVSLTPIPSQRSRPVRAEVSKWIILGFSFDNDFIDPIVANLKQQCPNGIISGILTKDETISYFLVFKKNVVASGYCGTSIAKNTTADKRRPTVNAEAEVNEMEQ